MAKNETITLTTATNQSLTFTAAKALTAAEVAAAFANLSKDATQGSSAVANGTYTNGTDGGLTGGFTTGAVTSVDADNATVTFSTTTDSDIASATTIEGLTIVASGTAGKATVGTEVAGTVAVAAVTGVLGVNAGKVVVNGAITGTDVLATVSVDAYGASSTVTSDALTTLTLKNAADDMTVHTASTGSLTLNLDKVVTGTNDIDLDGTAATLTGLTINTSGSASDVPVTATKVTALTVNAGANLDLTGSSFTALKTATITGASNVIVAGAVLTTLESINASASTGNITASINATVGTYTGSAGSDNVTLDTATTITKAIALGAGDDKLTLVSGTTTAGVTVDGGAGTDTLVMAAMDAKNASATDAFDTKVVNFEKLSLGQVAVDNTTATVSDVVAVDLSKLTYDYVISAGTTTGGNDSAQDQLTLDSMISGGTLEIAAEGLFNVNVKDAATGTADSLNLVVNVADNGTASSAATGITAGTVTAANVESIAIASSTADADGSSNSSLTLTANKATAVTVTGNNGLTLTMTDSLLVTSIDGSAMTGGLTVTSVNATTATTIKGGSGNDVLQGAADQDVLIGGAGNDKLTAVGELTTLTGGAGNDTFVMNTADSVNGYATITDLTAGDVIDTSATSFVSTKLTLADTAVFQDYANAAINAVGANGGIWFQYSGNTFVVVDAGADTTSFTNGQDQIIKISGTVDLSTAVFNATTGDLTIA